MHSGNHWGGSFEIHFEPQAEDEQSSNMEFDRVAVLEQLNETQQGWLLGHGETKKENKYVDLGCIMCKRKLLKWVLYSVLIGVIIVGVPIIIVKNLPKHRTATPVPDKYTIALHMALKFFNAQKSGHLPKNNGVSWRGDSGLHDGSVSSDVKGELVGGYYDSGNNMKFHFPLSFSMTLLSWSVIEYSKKYEAIGEYDHIKDIIKWGTDYLLQTFNSSASTISKIYSQVGTATRGSTRPDDGYCWQRPEDMEYQRLTVTSTSVADLGSEVASALAAASIVFRDDIVYSNKLIKAATTAYKLASEAGQQERPTYSQGFPLIADFYNSTGYWDDLLWGATWMYYATGNYSYLSLAIRSGFLDKARATFRKPDSNVFSWDNKLPGAELLLARLRIFLNPGYPYEELLSDCHNYTGLNLCSYLRQFHVFNWTNGGLIQLNRGQPRPLQYVANAAFLTSLFANYMNASNVPGWYCGPNYFDAGTLKSFAVSQVNYILGANPRKMSYLVGYGYNYPRHVHHRGASIPKGQKVSCKGGWKWRDSKAPNPNVITGAMVAGPDRYDGFSDVRSIGNYTEPTLAGNAGLVAALVSLTSSGGESVDRNTIFTFVPPLYGKAPPPSTWQP